MPLAGSCTFGPMLSLHGSAARAASVISMKPLGIALYRNQPTKKNDATIVAKASRFFIAVASTFFDLDAPTS